MGHDLIGLHPPRGNECVDRNKFLKRILRSLYLLEVASNIPNETSFWVLVFNLQKSR